MKVIYVLALLIFCEVELNAQTRRIAFKSHSGSESNYKQMLENHLFNHELSNFGVGPEPMVQNAHLDSIIFLPDSKVLMVTSYACKWRYSRESSVWRAGRDTVYNHPVFKPDQPVAKIIRTLKSSYYFENSMDSVRFADRSSSVKKQNPEQKSDSSHWVIAVKEEPVKPKTKTKRIRVHTPSHDIIWLMEMVSLITLAGSVALFKWR